MRRLFRPLFYLAFLSVLVARSPSLAADLRCAKVYGHTRVATLNLLNKNAPHALLFAAWDDRAQGVADWVRSEQIEILGTQEGVTSMMTDLAVLLPDYQSLGLPRSGSWFFAEHSQLFISKKRFEVLAHDTFWLSEHPEVSGVQGWDAANARTATYTRLRDLKTRGEFFVVNAHLDHWGARSRIESAKLIVTRLHALAKDLPVIFMGDLNATASDPTVGIFKNVWKESRASSMSSPTGGPATYALGWQLDYLFASDDFAICAHQTQDPLTRQGHALSDHSAVVVDLWPSAKRLLTQLTPEEKLKLLSGDGWWATAGIERLGLPAIHMADGSHGLRVAKGFDWREGEPATSFPTASILAASWDPELVEKVAAALAQEARHFGIGLLLGPGVNMKRSPLAGRNFEYFSEDPVLSGELATSYILSLQRHGVGAALKHFAVNSQESQRMSMSSNLDAPTMYDLYLPAFKIAIQNANPWVVMSAYNKVNGVPAVENRLLLTQILRDEWNYKGAVVSDWGALEDRTRSLKAGLNLDMPSVNSAPTDQLRADLAAGVLKAFDIDQAVEPMLLLLMKAAAQPAFQKMTPSDFTKHHLLARKVAAQSAVLLKNKGHLLPLDFRAVSSIAVIGAYAKAPRISGGGSSHVNATSIDDAVAEIARLGPKDLSLTYAEGYSADESEMPDAALDERRLHEAVKIAKAADIAIVFVGLPESAETEGEDRTSLDLPETQNRLVTRVCQAQKNCVVILMSGAAVTMPWISDVPAILYMGLGGQAVGGAVADLLTGTVNPSGKLSESFFARLEDTSTAATFPSMTGNADYTEGVFTGYRHIDRTKLTPIFPFGFGLSYTDFMLKDARVRVTKDSDRLVQLQVTLANYGALPGQEVVQVYLHRRGSTGVVKELKTFRKIFVAAQASETALLSLSAQAFESYDPIRKAVLHRPGDYELWIGTSSAGPFLKKKVTIP